MISIVKAVAALGLAALPFVGAQLEGLSTVHCMPSFGWSNNSLSQNPCLVSAWLQAQCAGGQFSMNPLPAGYHYIGPTNDTSTQNPCICSTPVYMLGSACGACQNETWITWDAWSFHCPASMLSPPGTYNPIIPEQTLVPQWAFSLPSSNTEDEFDPTKAKLTGDQPESSHVLSSSTTSTTSTTSSTTSTTTTMSTTTMAPSSSSSPTSSSSTSSSGGGGGKGSSTDVGAIAGGVVGGVLGLALIALLGFFLMRHHNAPSKDPSANGTGTREVQGQYTGGTGGTGGYGQPGYGGQPGPQPAYYNNNVGGPPQMRYSGMPEV